MHFGITILPEHRWADAEPLWRASEQFGFDHAWTYDHITWSGLPDAPDLKGDNQDDWWASLRDLNARLDDALTAAGRDSKTFPRYVNLDSGHQFSLASVGVFEDMVGHRTYDALRSSCAADLQDVGDVELGNMSSARVGVCPDG